jgi:hypothetical protein
MKGRIEIYMDENEKYYLRLILDAGRAGQVEFKTSYPVGMSRHEAESRLFRLSETYGFDREHLPVSNGR